MVKPQIAYLCSQYPAVSHTFINREIEQILKQEIQVHPFTMRPGKFLKGAAPFVIEQDRVTFCIHKQWPWRMIAAWLVQFARKPIGFIVGFFYALRLQQGRPKETLWAVFHFLEAVVLARVMEKRGISHVHVHFAGPEAAVALYAHRAFGLSYSLTLHGPDVFYNVALGNLKTKLSQAAFIICISHFARGQALRLLGAKGLKRTHIVRCGVDPNQFKPVKRAEPFEDRPFTMVCTGRLTPTKGQALLILACAALAAENFSFRCILIGPGDDRPNLEALIEEHKLGEHVILTGALPQHGVREQLERADLFVLPTFAEGVPVVLMEAMAMEIPCVTTRVAGIAELIDHEHDGWLIHSGDPVSLTHHLRMLMKDPNQLEAVGKRARAKVIDLYHIEKNGARLAQIFRERLTASHDRSTSEDHPRSTAGSVS